MKIIAIHTITDTAGFENAEEKAFQALNEGKLQLPEGVILVSRAHNSPRTKQVCTWEAPSIEVVEEIIEPLLGQYCENEYFEADITTF